MLHFMQRCFDLACRSFGRQSPNPMVGAVIVQHGKILGEGFHQKYGSPHAEINALNSITGPIDPAHASLYVSLEPCFHFGKTPPCVDAVLAHRFEEVNISVLDINPQTCGRSVEKLRRHGVKVTQGIMQQKGLELIRPFITNQTLHRPYTLIKFAVSADGFIGQQGRQVWLSNPFSLRLVHLWRSKFDAILVGGNTVRTDNPRLNTRYFHKINPLRVVLTRTGNFQKNLHIFDNNNPTIVATLNHKLLLPGTGTQLWKLNPNEEYLKTLLKKLYSEKNIGTLMVEGGAQTIQSFIDAGLWDEIRIIRTQKSLGSGIPQPQLKNARFLKAFPMAGDVVEVFVKR